MSTKANSTTQSTSFKTNIIDESGVILAEWFSLNRRTEDNRREVAADLGEVLSTGICAQCQWAIGGNGDHCGECSCCS